MTAHFYSFQRIKPGEVVQIGGSYLRVLGFECQKGRDGLLRYKCYFERCPQSPTSGLEKLIKVVDTERTSVLEII